MSDYDPDRPSGSGAEPIDPSGGAPYEGSAEYPPGRYPYPIGPPAGPPQFGYGYPSGQPGGPSYSPAAGNPVSASPTGYPVAGPGGMYPAPYQAGPAPFYPGPFQPAPSYPPYSQYPGAGWSGPSRPGQVTGAAVLSYIEAGWLLISALFIFAGASAVNDFTDNTSLDDGGLTAQFVLAGLANLIAGGLFIAGAATFSGANPTGRQLLVVATALTAASALYWIIRFHDSALVVWAVAYLTMPAIALSLSFGASVSAWLQTASAQRRPGGG